MFFLESVAEATLLPVETVSVALSAAPKAIPVLGNILKLATDIRETTERVEANKEHCEQLSERIDTLIGFLAERDLSRHLNEAMHMALRRFEAFLRRCLEFISTFLEASWFKRIRNHKDYEKKFQDLNRDLTQYSNDLNFGIGLNNMQMNTKQDRNQRIEMDLNESEQLDEDYQHQRTSEMINREHYHHHLVKTAGKPPINNVRPIVNSEYPHENIFVNGHWKYGYRQYNQYHGPFPQKMIFDPKTRTLHGNGEDNVGKYVLNGTFSETTRQLEMTQSYEIGTGNPTINLGHQDIMQLNWNPSRKVFEGVGYSKVLDNYIPGSLIELWHA